MISIRKYLYADGRRVAAAAAPDAVFGLYASLFDQVGRHVLTGGPFAALQAQWREAESALRPDLAAQAAETLDGATEGILAGYEALRQEGATSNAVEMRHILGMLDQALAALAGGSDRSQDHLQKIQESLRRASTLSNVVAMRASLAETIRYAEDATVKEEETAKKENAALVERAAEARSLLGRAFRGLAGRHEGVQKIREAWTAAPPEQALYLVAFLVDRLPVIVSRYGAGVAEELLLRLIKERLQPVAAESAAYRWTSASLVGVFYRRRDLTQLREEMIRLNRTPLVHPVALGGRTAVLTLSPSHLVAEGEGDDPEVLIAEADRFTGSHGPD